MEEIKITIKEIGQKTKEMSKHFPEKILKQTRPWFFLFCISLISQFTNAQSCDFTTGPVSLNVQGGNQTDAYNTLFVLTSFDGLIIDINPTEPLFEVNQEGFYAAYAINFSNGTNLTGIELGGHIDQVSGDDCQDVGSPYGFTVCQDVSPCNHCLGEVVTLNSSGGNNSGSFTTKFVLTDNNGEILRIQDEAVFDSLDAGVYLAFPINYETAKVILGLEVGLNIARVQSGCLDLGEPYVISVCDQLQPTIFFDLKGCDITQTAILQVGEIYNSYEWSTGATSDFIEVSATTPETYYVTVTLNNGCIGIGRQTVTGNEISRLGDYVWEDTDFDGRQDAEEQGLNGVTVNLFTDFDRNGLPDFPNLPSCVTTTTNHPQTGEPGYYEFTLYSATYVVGFLGPNGFVPTSQNQGDDSRDNDANENGLTGSIFIGEGSTITNVDAGFVTSTSICGLVWEDLDGDGRQELNQGEEGVDGVTLNLFNTNGDLVATTVTFTDPNGIGPGAYCFDNIGVQEYFIELVLPNGRILTLPNVGLDEGSDSDATGANGQNTTDLLVTSPGQVLDDITFGIYTGGTVCGIVWKENTEGLGVSNVYDEGIDSVISNSQVDLIDASSDQVVLTVATGSDGTYCIGSIPVGSYQIMFRASGSGTDYVQSFQGDDPLLDSDVDINTGKTGSFFIAPGDSLEGINAGLRLEALPIDLISFEGYWDGTRSENILIWQTASEINNDYFEIQRVFENGEFEPIGLVDGQGTTVEFSDYQYSDADIRRSGTYYYRLKQVDFNGGFEYSNIVAIDVLLNEHSGFSVFPNPVKERLMLEVMVKNDDYGQISLTDVLGREVYTGNDRMLYSGKNMIELGVRDIPNGSYMVAVRIGNLKQHKLINIAH